jgi:hypothetical protein
MINEHVVFLAVSGSRGRIAQFCEFVKSMCKRVVVVRR